MATQTGADRSALAHLFRRAGFGARPDELDAAVRQGYPATVARLLDATAADPGVAATPPPTLTVAQPPRAGGDPQARRAAQASLASQGRALTLWWLDRMVMATNPLPEKLAFFWHGHFATSIQKVRQPALMLRQYQLFRSLGAGRFDQLTQAVAKDPAMMIWLDARSNRRQHPNENFARELMELFTLGVGSYSETDVREAARAFTGWSLTAADTFRLVAAEHDDGAKTVLGRTGSLTGEDVVSQVTASPVSSRWVIARMWSRFAMPVVPPDSAVSALLPAYRDRDCGQLIAALLSSPTFQSVPVRQGLIKQPVEYVVGVLRALRLRADDPKLLSVLQALGQVPFAPPNVGGWPANEAWLTTAASLARLRFAESVTAKADLSAVADQPATARPDAAAHLLGLDGWSPRTAMVLRSAADDPARLMTLAMVAPEYVVN